MNTFGHTFRFTSFGESHGSAIGGVIDGCPAGLVIDFAAIDAMLSRRAGRGISSSVSSRAQHENDHIEWLSGIYEGKTLGTPIAFLIRNTDQHSSDYDLLRDICRPSHADYTYQIKYGIRDYRGGGRASARETASRVVAGSIAMQILHSKGITIKAQIAQIGDSTNPNQWDDLLRSVAADGDSIGGIIQCTISGVPAGVGEPIFDKLQSQLAAAMLSINACKGFDYGSGFEGVGKRGSELNDTYQIAQNRKATEPQADSSRSHKESKDADTLTYNHIEPTTNHTGGILGGISTGQDITFRTVFKPTPSIAHIQHTVDNNGNPIDLSIKGRHDVCIVPRALPVVEAMAALTIINAL